MDSLGACVGDEDAAKALEPAKPMEIDFEDLDVMAVEDILDLGNGMPLFDKPLGAFKGL